MRSTPQEIRYERRCRVWSLRDEGWTHARIAQELSLHRSTIGRILRGQRPFPLPDSSASERNCIKRHQARQLAHIVEEAFDAWERSKHSQVIRKVSKKSNSAKGEPVVEVKMETTRKEQSGSAGYLSQARYAMTELRKLWEEGNENPTDSTGQVDPRVAEAAIQAALAVEQKLLKKKRGKRT